MWFRPAECHRAIAAICATQSMLRIDRSSRVKKTVDVFLKDELVASYPVVVPAIDRPSDDDFIEQVQEMMRSYYSAEDIRAAEIHRSQLARLSTSCQPLQSTGSLGGSLRHKPAFASVLLRTFRRTWLPRSWQCPGVGQSWQAM